MNNISKQINKNTSYYIGNIIHTPPMQDHHVVQVHLKRKKEITQWRMN